MHRTERTQGITMVHRKYTEAQLDKLTRLTSAVLLEGQGLIYEILFIRLDATRLPKTKAVYGIHFGEGFYSGYILDRKGEPCIAMDVEQPKRHSELQVRFNIPNYLLWLLIETAEAEVDETVERVLWQIERLLPDGHPLKRLESDVDVKIRIPYTAGAQK